MNGWLKKKKSTVYNTICVIYYYKSNKGLISAQTEKRESLRNC